MVTELAPEKNEQASEAGLKTGSELTHYDGDAVTEENAAEIAAKCVKGGNHVLTFRLPPMTAHPPMAEGQLTWEDVLEVAEMYEKKDISDNGPSGPRTGALKWFRQFRFGNPNKEFFVRVDDQIAFLHHRDQNYGEARKLWQKVADLVKNDPDRVAGVHYDVVLINISYTYLQEANWVEAAKWIEKAVQQNGEHVRDAEMILAWYLWQKLDQKERAKELYNHIVEANDSHYVKKAKKRIEKIDKELTETSPGS